MSDLNYKGYTAKVTFSPEDGLLVGQVCDVEALILFSAESVSEIKVEFHAAIDAYLADCAEAGIAAEKAYKGSFNVRVGGELHRRSACIARDWNLTLNEFVRIALEQAVDRHACRSPASQTKSVDTVLQIATYRRDEPISNLPVYQH